MLNNYYENKFEMYSVIGIQYSVKFKPEYRILNTDYFSSAVKYRSNNGLKDTTFL